MSLATPQPLDQPIVRPIVNLVLLSQIANRDRLAHGVSFPMSSMKRVKLAGRGGMTF
jgi:hypothetical protein